ncbi:MAG: hypothetical protein JXJ04_21450 [Spirochaetales bacterium]|nr:hypothetical protein [Spirochaetales bacterium]
MYHARNAKERIVEQDDFPYRVQYTLIQKDNALFFLFLNEQAGDFPMFGRGNTSIKKSEKNGDIIQMTILLRDHNDCYIRFTPYNDRTSADLFLFGSRLYHNVPIALPFTTLIFESFGTIVDLTKNSIDWDIILYKGLDKESENGLDVFKKIREFLPRLKTAEDGAQSGNGDYVYIRDLSPQKSHQGFNCSGFAKWIIDGFYYPLSHTYIDIDILKTKNPDIRGNRWSDWYEDERDPFFGLDWTRNLALALSNKQNNTANQDPESFDVRNIPFFEYVEDVGYPVKDIEVILFLLASRDPNSFYLASVNKTIGKNPAMQQHFHIAVFFPYFMDTNSFTTIVMEKNRETRLSSFKVDYENTYIHLVKIKIKGKFDPPLL